MKRLWVFLLAALALTILVMGFAMAEEKYACNTDEAEISIYVLEDGTAEIYHISFTQEFENSGAAEYTLPETVQNKNGDVYTVSAILGLDVVYSVYHDNNVETVIIPDSVNVIGNPFSGYDALKHFVVSDSHPTLAVVDEALYNKETKALLAYPPQLEGVFAILDGIEEIGDYAFRFSHLTQVTVPDSVTRMGANPFCTSRIKSVLISADHPTLAVEKYGVYDKNARSLIAFIGEPDGIIQFAVPEGIVSIGDYAFRYADLVSVTLPSTLQSIGSYAFENCFKLETVNIPDGLESIGQYAFDSCWVLSSLELPDSITEIGEGAFMWMKALKSLRIPAQITVIPERLCFGCEGLEEIILPEGLKEIQWQAFSYTKSMRQIQFPSTLETIRSQAFENSAVESITLPESATDLQREAFQYMTELKQVTLDDQIKVLPDQLFFGCEKLEMVILPEGLEEIKSSVFGNCPALKEIYIPVSVEKIGSLNDVCAVVEEGSMAHNWCVKNNKSFILTKDYTGDLPIPEQAKKDTSVPDWLKPTEAPALTACPYCGLEFPDGHNYKFCPACGHEL